MNLRDHAERELELAGVESTSDGYSYVLSLVDLVLGQSHPNQQSFKATVAFFFQICNGEPLSPLTGSDDEWDQISPLLWQNNRFPRVFKELGVGAYDIGAIVFIDESDRMFTQQPQSRIIVKFPYTPNTKYMRVKTDDAPRIVMPYGTRKQ